MLVQKFHGVTFIASPYEMGTALREDLFKTQFRVVIEGEAAYREDDPVFGHYYRDVHVSGGRFGILGELFLTLSKSIEDDCVDVGRLAEDDDFESFDPHRVRIYDRHNKFVMGGIVERGAINWVRPVFDPFDQALIILRSKRLQDEASEESRWDNFCSAKSFRGSARNIEMHITKSRYEFLNEISHLKTTDLFQ